MKYISKFLATVILFLICGTHAHCLDLPVKRINGVDYYYYEVKNKESLTDVAAKLGVSRNDIIDANPVAADGIRKGMKLFFPVSDFPEQEDVALTGGESNNEGGTPIKYKVKKGDTLYSLSHKFDVTPDEILKLNPTVKNGLKADDTILIPGKNIKETAETVIEQKDNETPDDTNIMTEDSAPKSSVTPILPVAGELVSADYMDEESTPKSSVSPILPVTGELVSADYMEEESQDAETEDGSSYVSDSDNDTLRISLILPLMLTEEERDKAAKQNIDFIRGFMLGVNSMNKMNGNVGVNVYDTKRDAKEYAGILKNPEVINSSIIIANEDGTERNLIQCFVKANDNYLFNLFAPHDSSYLTNNRVLQTNIPASDMYEKALTALSVIYGNYRPVFISSKNGRNEKMPFVNLLQNHYSDLGIEPINIIFEGLLSMQDLEVLNEDEKYIFIPLSGSLSEFNKFARALLKYRESVIDPSTVVLFGYPDWTTFRNEPLEMLHRLGATIYSRFYCDANGNDKETFDESFKEYYGEYPLEQAPSQAMLGYDAAIYLLGNINKNNGIFNPDYTRLYRGIQSSFLFMSPDINEDEQIINESDVEYIAADDEVATEEQTSGYVNSSLYIITFRGDNTVDVHVI